MTDADKKLYDKAVEALDQMGAGLPSEIEKYVPAWIDGYKEGLKAKINATTISDCPIKDEWHYPSKGELPKCDEETQLIFYVNCYYKIDGETLKRKRTVLGYYQNSFLNDDIKLFVEKSKGYEEEHLPQDVIAWKEIVLPKEVE